MASIEDYIVNDMTPDEVRKALSATFWRIIKKNLANSIKADYKKVLENHPALIIERSSEKLGRPPTAFSKSLTALRLAKALFAYANGDYPAPLNETEEKLLMIVVSLLDLLDELASEVLEEKS